MDKKLETFDAAVEHIKVSENLNVSNDEKLKFYALFKQATSGDCSAPEPSRFSVVSHAKWKAWEDLRGLSKEEAMGQYISTVQKVDHGFKIPSLLEPEPQPEPIQESQTSAPISEGKETVTQVHDQGILEKEEGDVQENRQENIGEAEVRIEKTVEPLFEEPERLDQSNVETSVAEESTAKVVNDVPEEASEPFSLSEEVIVPNEIAPESSKEPKERFSITPRASPVQGSVNTGNSGPSKEVLVVSPSPAAMKTFYLSLYGCVALSGIGIIGFLVTTLSNQALAFLGLAGAGIVGIVASFAQLLSSYGLIALYPQLLQRILLDRTLVEVILEGTIFQRIRDTITEIYPIIYCKTHEDRLAVLANMSENTRKIMTTRGVVNLLPEWQQRITLSRNEYAAQKSKLENEQTAFRPALDATADGRKRRNPAIAELNAQRALASTLMRRSIQDRISKFAMDKINPDLCKGISASLGLVFLVQLRLSARARQSVLHFVRGSALQATSVGTIFFALLALAHELSKKYRTYRDKELQKQSVVKQN